MCDWEVTSDEIEAAEKLLLPQGFHFAEDAQDVIRYWKSTDVSACPGSGKTTVLLAKLKLLADKMPFENGAGICVLSHTNVAVNEIKTKLSDYAEKLMGYPNYVGTIQSFVDYFITFPYLRSVTSEPIQLVDNKVYAQHLIKLFHSNRAYQTINNKINTTIRQRQSRYTDSASYVENLYLYNGALMIRGQEKPIARASADSAKQYSAAVKELLMKEGLVTYNHAYTYALSALSSNTSLSSLLSKRFQFVFIDEYQDCSQIQRDILSMAFNDQTCCVFRIGDPDQAIYNSENELTEDWLPAADALHISSSSRYSQEIADILSPLRSGKLPINSLTEKSCITPSVIIFDDSTIKCVVNKFIVILEELGLNDPDGTYKAIGWIKNETAAGRKIGDYWDGFQASNGSMSENRYWPMVDAICDELVCGKIYKAESIFRKLLCRVLKFLKQTDDEGKTYTFTTVKKALDDRYFDVYRKGIMSLTTIPEYSRLQVDPIVRSTINVMLDPSGEGKVDAFSALPRYFMEDTVIHSTGFANRNVVFDPIRGRKIIFSTIHGVKGETHDATLYLETETRRSSDIKRIIAQYTGARQENKKINNYSRKCAYVGFSRPRKLLCVAIHEKTYTGNEDAFKAWKIYDCRDNGKP